MRNCFVCTTPYQILATLSLVNNVDGSSDLYIVDQFVGAEVLANRIRKEHIFGEVICIEEARLLQNYYRTDGPIEKRIGIIQAYIDADKIVKQFIKNSSEYTHVFITSNGVIAQLIVLYLHKHYGLSNYSYFDDGVGSYCTDIHTRTSLLAQFCRQIFVDKKAYQLREYDLYMYSKMLYHLMHKDEKHNVHEFKFLDNNADNRALICRIFGMKTINIIKEKIIVLDSLKEKELTKSGVDLLLNIYDTINDKVGEKNTIFKAHPRDKNLQSKLNYMMPEGSVSLPFEIYGMTQDLSNKVLITNMSTAVFSPKLVLHQEPTIILLYKILEDYLIKKTRIDDVVSNFKKIYSDPSKICVPKTKEELIYILENIV